jgi:hypothetical protein
MILMIVMVVLVLFVFGIAFGLAYYKRKQVKHKQTHHPL